MQSANKKYSKDEINKAINTLHSSCGDDWYKQKDCLFNIKDINGSMSKEELVDLMKKVTKRDDISKEVEILYELMNTDCEEGISADEFSTAFDNNNKNDKISSFEFWNNLYGVEGLNDDGTEKA